MQAKKINPASIFDDLNLLIGNNKALIVLAVFLIFIVFPLAGEWRSFRKALDRDIFYQDPEITILEGEEPKDANIGYTIERMKDGFNKRYLSVYTKDIPEENYISIKYEIPIAKDGTYKIFVAGSHPGSKIDGNFKYYSQYEVSVGGRAPIEFYEEKKIDELYNTMGSIFYAYYAYAGSKYFTKIGEFELEKGYHEIEFRIHHSRLRDEYYVFTLDAIFILPKDWQPKKELFSYPLDILSY